MSDRLVLRKVLDIPVVYAAFQKMIAKKRARQWSFEKYIGDISGKRILDLGCGTADILDHIYDEKIYVGIDNNRQYIEENKMLLLGKFVQNHPRFFIRNQPILLSIRTGCFPVYSGISLKILRIPWPCS